MVYIAVAATRSAVQWLCSPHQILRKRSEQVLFGHLVRAISSSSQSITADRSCFSMRNCPHQATRAAPLICMPISSVEKLIAQSCLVGWRISRSRYWFLRQKHSSVSEYLKLAANVPHSRASKSNEASRCRTMTVAVDSLPGNDCRMRRKKRRNGLPTEPQPRGRIAMQLRARC